MDRKRLYSEAEDELMLRAWLRWHAKHGFERECFTQARNRLPQLDLLESQVRVLVTCVSAYARPPWWAGVLLLQFVRNLIRVFSLLCLYFRESVHHNGLYGNSMISC